MNVYVNEEIILFNIANMHLWTCRYKTCRDGSHLAKYYNSEKSYVCYIRIYELSESSILVKGRYCNADIECKFNCIECTEFEILSKIEQSLLINLTERIKKWTI